MSNVHTWAVLPKANHSSTFSTDTINVQRDYGFSLGVTVTSASSLQMSIHLEASACDTDTWAIIPGSIASVTENQVVIYNHSDVYFKNVKAVFTFVTGSADIYVECTTKSN